MKKKSFFRVVTIIYRILRVICLVPANFIGVYAIMLSVVGLKFGGFLSDDGDTLILLSACLVVIPAIIDGFLVGYGGGFESYEVGSHLETTIDLSNHTATTRSVTDFEGVGPFGAGCLFSLGFILIYIVAGSYVVIRTFSGWLRFINEWFNKKLFLKVVDCICLAVIGFACVVVCLPALFLGACRLGCGVGY